MPAARLGPQPAAAGLPWFRAAAGAGLVSSAGLALLLDAIATLLSARLQDHPLSATHWILLGLVGLAAQTAASLVAGLFAARGAAAVERSARRQGLAAVLSPGAAPGNSATASRLLVEEARKMAEATARWEPARLRAVLVPALLVGLAFAVNWLVGLLLLLAAPLIPLNMAAFGLGAQRLSEQQAIQMASLDELVLDRIKGAATLRAFGAAQRERAVGPPAADALARRARVVGEVARG